MSGREAVVDKLTMMSARGMNLDEADDEKGR